MLGTATVKYTDSFMEIRDQTNIRTRHVNIKAREREGKVQWKLLNDEGKTIKFNAIDKVQLNIGGRRSTHPLHMRVTHRALIEDGEVEDLVRNTEPFIEMTMSNGLPFEVSLYDTKLYRRIVNVTLKEEAKPVSKKGKKKTH